MMTRTEGGDMNAPRTDHRALRDVLLFGLGAWSFVAQVLADVDRPLLLAVTCALLGLPVTMRRDESNQEGGDDDA